MTSAARPVGLAVPFISTGILAEPIVELEAGAFVAEPQLVWVGNKDGIFALARGATPADNSEAKVGIDGLGWMLATVADGLGATAGGVAPNPIFPPPLGAALGLCPTSVLSTGRGTTWPFFISFPLGLPPFFVGFEAFADLDLRDWHAAESILIAFLPSPFNAGGAFLSGRRTTILLPVFTP